MYIQPHQFISNKYGNWSQELDDLQMKHMALSQLPKKDKDGQVFTYNVDPKEEIAALRHARAERDEFKYKTYLAQKYLNPRDPIKQWYAQQHHKELIEEQEKALEDAMLIASQKSYIRHFGTNGDPELEQLQYLMDQVGEDKLGPGLYVLNNPGDRYETGAGARLAVKALENFGAVGSQKYNDKQIKAPFTFVDPDHPRVTMAGQELDLAKWMGGFGDYNVTPARPGSGTGGGAASLVPAPEPDAS